MVLGRKGLQLEAWKFGVYLSIPVIASLAFNEPEVQRYFADYFQFLKYPANPNTNLKEEFEELQKKKKLEKEQRLAYKLEVQTMQDAAKRAREEREQAVADSGKNNGRGWLRWIGLGRGGQAGAQDQSGASSG